MNIHSFFHADKIRFEENTKHKNYSLFIADDTNAFTRSELHIVMSEKEAVELYLALKKEMSYDI